MATSIAQLPASDTRPEPSGRRSFLRRSAVADTARQTAASDAPVVASDTDVPASETPGLASRAASRAVAVIASVGGTVVAGIGFAGSYRALRDLAFDHGFGDFAYAFPVGIDAGIVAMYALDLHLIRKQTPMPVLRLVAHLLTMATILFNASAAAKGGIRADSLGAAMHGALPLLFVASVEAARRLIVKAADIESGQMSDGVPVIRWALAPRASYLMWRQMKLWSIRSYDTVVTREKERVVYREMLDRETPGGWRKAKSDERLPLTMARFGLTVDEALALPQQAAEDAQRRAEEQAEREQAAADRAADRDAETRIAALRRQGRIEATGHEVAAETGVAQAQARAQQQEAEALASAQARAAVLEAEALELADTAEADARRVEAEQRAAEAKQAAAEANERAAEADRAAAEARTRAAEADGLAAAKRARIQEDDAHYAKASRDAAEAKQAAAEANRLAAEAEARAVEADALAKLSPTEVKVRKVARMALAAPEQYAPAVPLEAIQDALGVSLSTASDYRTQAAALIADGYRG